ncbi:aldose epimerase family protein [Pontibacter mangrovi]|uniref:Aldose 1-epimerase n=1 Tax=Pontibacter mangrovi TaxID=2589816 RepID=A0A501W364_9BACT|nr:aldose epimerase family protein [Pontibacter mangrovi]TPE44049.1 galactose mutarotase [Pontibacter mangrovi]
MKIGKFIAPCLYLLLAASCNNQTDNTTAGTSVEESASESKLKSTLDPANFERELDGKQVQLYFLKNKNGLEMAVTNYGAKVVSLLVPDKDGKMEDVVLGFDNLDGYLNANEPYFGAAIGRYGNRIANGKFTLDGKQYKLATNNAPNHLHGGTKGFNAQVWDAKQVNDQTIEFTRLSPDGEEGYPGNLQVKMVYTLTDDNAFKITYDASTDQPTPINLTHHSFFNLHGAGKGSINDHVLMINADAYTPVDETLIPTGKLEKVAGTPMDFREPTEIGKRVEDDFEQLKFGKGYDHNWVLKDSSNSQKLAATVWEPTSGRYMEVYTTEPGLQFYGGNFLDGKDKGKGDKPYEFRSAFCLETQHFPDSPNQPNFPSTILQPGEQYQHTAIYKFSVK